MALLTVRCAALTAGCCGSLYPRPFDGNLHILADTRRNLSAAHVTTGYAGVMSDLRHTGDAWVIADDGGRYWGKFGAAGLMAFDPQRGILMQHRVSWSDHGGTWGIPGGARHEDEAVVEAALRESHEEAGVPRSAILPRFTYQIDRGGWTYTTVIAEVTLPFEPEITDPESHELSWVPLDEVSHYELHPGFAASWPLLKAVLSDDRDTIDRLLAQGTILPVS